MASLAFWPDPRVKRVADYLGGIEFSELNLWDQLDILSTHTRIEAVEIPTEGIVVGPDNHFSAAVNLYVSLEYGREDEEGFTSSDSFLGKIKGHFEDDNPVIDESSVDTTSFYE